MLQCDMGTVLDMDRLVELLERNCTCQDITLQSRFFNHHNDTKVYAECTDFPIKHTFMVQVFYMFMFSFLVLASVGGNLTVAWIVLRHERMRTVTNYYLFNLAISDLTITILNTGFSSVYNLYYNWYFPDWYCAFNNLMAITPICASVFTMIVMSIDRYMAIVYPLKRRPGKRSTLTIICAIWVLAFLFGLPAFLFSKMEYHIFMNDYDKTVIKDSLCLADKFPDGDVKTSLLFNVYNHSIIVMQYVIPLLILSFTYGRVVYVLRQNTTIGDTRNAESVRTKRKAANMLALVVVTFVLMWLPYNVYFLFLTQELENVLSFQTTLYVYLNIYFLGMSSCALNPIIYYFMNERFRLGFRYAFRWLPWVKIKREEYESVFMSDSRASHLNPRHSNAHNIVYSTTLTQKSGQCSPVPL
ncbi:unnamed protein product [Bursaphelenchus okinawaensis]|uniref:G-protein coupled receptors family 1 profile domain-containing protein n=1 Tax=Bursaphelenchus okinawaensis TaxID=465554 RepID=A0A811L1U0_9BILA|nr:unnamed protein product [Bursaphelenchus okinawaensis]CAG9115308.1 unnamed protein product [Bursaphelenchus okinawaensis]